MSCNGVETQCYGFKGLSNTATHSDGPKRRVARVLPAGAERCRLHACGLGCPLDFKPWGGVHQEPAGRLRDGRLEAAFPRDGPAR